MKSLTQVVFSFSCIKINIFLSIRIIIRRNGKHLSLSTFDILSFVIFTMKDVKDFQTIVFHYNFHFTQHPTIFFWTRVYRKLHCLLIYLFFLLLLLCFLCPFNFIALMPLLPPKSSYSGKHFAELIIMNESLGRSFFFLFYPQQKKGMRSTFITLLLK